VLSGFQFVNKDQPLVTKGFESNGRLVFDEFQLFVGYTYIDAHRKYDNVQSFIPLTPRNKVNLDVIYEIENNVSLAFEGIYLSSMFRDADIKTKEYYTMGLVLQKYFKHFTIIANCENMLDVRQTRFENIVIPPITSPEFRQIYAPLNGRVFNIALRVKL